MNVIKFRFRILLSALAGLYLTACTSVPLEEDVYPNDPEFAPVSPQALQPPPSVNGSLFRMSHTMSLYTDQQARRVGDIITVIFDEAMTSKKSAETSTQKDSANNMTPTNLLNTVPAWRGLGLNADTEGKRKFTGKGDADRSNSLQGTISVTVAGIMPNGVLKIRGEKWLTLSEGDEYIRIQGLVRPEDVTPTNTIRSTQVADARITFGGKGNLNNSTKQGWFDRMLNSPWFPF